MNNFQYSDSIIGDDRIDLIPYKSEHVEEYNKWLQCHEIQELTETEAVSLEEEYSFQKEWENDNQRTKLIKLIRLKENDKLIGDVNLFFQEDKSVEINLMISDSNYRGKGLAKEVLILLLRYIKASDRPFERIVAKVLSTNVSSIKFFEKFGFVQEGSETVFKEIILVYELSK